MKELPLAHFYHREIIPAELQGDLLSEFADNGGHFLALPEKLLLKFAEEGGREEFSAKVRACGMFVIEAHGLWGIGRALNTPEPDIIPGVLKPHRECPRIQSLQNEVSTHGRGVSIARMSRIYRNLSRASPLIAFCGFLHLCKVRHLHFFGSYLLVAALKIPNTVFLHIC